MATLGYPAAKISLKEDVVPTLFPVVLCWRHQSVEKVSLRNEGVWGSRTPHKARGTSHKKEKCKLGGSHILSLYRCNYPSAVPLVAACEATLVRLC